MARQKRTREKVKNPPELQKLSRDIGGFIEYWGFKSIHGRIWMHLFLTEKPLDAGELIDRLNVSKGLVSLAIADLLKYEVILDCGKSAAGTRLFLANAELSEVILRVLRNREHAMLSRLSSEARFLEKISEADASRMGVNPERAMQLAQLIHGAKGTLEMWLSLGENADLKLEELFMALAAVGSLKD